MHKAMWRKWSGPEAVSSWGLGSVTVGTGAQRGIRVRGGQAAEEPVAVRAHPRSSQADRAERNSHGRASERGRWCLKYLRAWEPQEKSVRFFRRGTMMSLVTWGQAATFPRTSGYGPRTQTGTPGPGGGGCLRPQKPLWRALA